MLQAVHGWSSTYERLVKSQNFFSSYLTQEDMSSVGITDAILPPFIPLMRDISPVLTDVIPIVMDGPIINASGTVSSFSNGGGGSIFTSACSISFLKRGEREKTVFWLFGYILVAISRNLCSADTDTVGLDFNFRPGCLGQYNCCPQPSSDP